jgi:hypothetical protein
VSCRWRDSSALCRGGAGSWPGDVAVFKCGACGHTAELPLSALLRGLGLKPTDKVLDLERRLRCRLCHAKDQVVVSIQKATVELQSLNKVFRIRHPPEPEIQSRPHA